MSEAAVPIGISWLAKVTQSARDAVAPKLEAGEIVFAAVLVSRADPWVRVVTTLPWLLPVYWLIVGVSLPELVALLVLVAIVVFIADRLIKKPRILALTDRRVFVCPTTLLFRRRDSGVETEWRRGRISVHRLSKGRLRVCVDQAGCMRLSAFPPFTGLIEDWAPTSDGTAA